MKVFDCNVVNENVVGSNEALGLHRKQNAMAEPFIIEREGGLHPSFAI
jgi:hypothetical protein